ncbi:alginate export family protein [Candidatus Nitrotoga sp. 1052]|uniref:alginate export family protein n=1 Tax=Candidatus Nitrotoga sp. 1052 TaxID=2886964 RepID=UPI001EF4F9E1|nr:alginate export family protein [Candidatus Nitrotoga sp. 1052]CAH1085416.1 Alginate export [Candidatus Nitrotoga sp. 1052]
MKLKNRTLFQQMSLVFTPLALLALAPQAYSADYADYAAGGSNVGGLYTPAPKAAGTFTEAFTGGKVTANLQARYENVDQPAPGTGAPLKDAHAATLRLRLGYETAEYMGFGGLVQIEHISANDAYNSRVNGRTNYSVVADAKVTELNQAYISYSGIPQTRVKFGRQLIRLDNDRWVGNVVWRQNQQTYDATSVVNKSLPDTTITAAFITNANRVFSDASIDNGTGALLGNHHMRSPIFNVKYTGLGFAEVVGYGYFLDYDPSARAFGLANSTRTVGARFKGDAPMGDNKILYAAEYASQSDYKDNPSDYRVHYTLLEGGVDVKAAQFKVGYELLSGNGKQSLQTPLATLFAFNGWADVFLVTPRNGLQDIYVNARTTVAGIVLGADYHDFQADHGSSKYGTEIDLIATKQIDKTYSVGTRYARFRADNNTAAAAAASGCATCFDTSKFWVYGAMNF